MDELASGRVDRTKRADEPCQVLDLREVLGGQLTPGDALADRPVIRAAVEKRRTRYSGDRRVEAFADGDHVRPGPLAVLTGYELPGTPAVADPSKLRHAEAVATKAVEERSLPLELLDGGVQRLQNELATAPRRPRAAGERLRLGRDAERRENGRGGALHLCGARREAGDDLGEDGRIRADRLQPCLRATCRLVGETAGRLTPCAAA